MVLVRGGGKWPPINNFGPNVSLFPPLYLGLSELEFRLPLNLALLSLHPDYSSLIETGRVLAACDQIIIRFG